MSASLYSPGTLIVGADVKQISCKKKDYINKNDVQSVTVVFSKRKQSTQTDYEDIYVAFYQVRLIIYEVAVRTRYSAGHRYMGEVYKREYLVYIYIGII